MIVLYKIKEDAYETSSKNAIPAMIVAYVPTPEKPIKMADTRLGEAHYRFIHDNKNELIQRFLKDLEAAGSPYVDDIPYYASIITDADPDIIDKYPNGIISMSTTHSDEHMHRRLIADDVLPLAAAMATSGQTCQCCMLSDNIYDVLKKYQGDAINCPHCGKAIDTVTLEPTAVQEANYYEPYHHIGMYPVTECLHCGNHLALVPTPISWNADHDVYYTGGAAYMEDEFTPKSAEEELKEIFNRHLFQSVKQYVDRILAGEKGLSEWNLKIWTERDFAAAFCEYFYNHGLKE